MSENLIQVNVVSPEGAIFEGSAKMVIVRGAEGEIGISYGHTQLLTSLPPGLLRIIFEDDKEQYLFVAGGIFESQPKHVIVLADVVERPVDINEASAQQAKEKAKRTIQQADADAKEVEKAQKTLAEAQARLKVLALFKNKNIR
jgi:F-type H+-transporting ATPase subunit epsilon